MSQEPTQQNGCVHPTKAGCSPGASLLSEQDSWLLQNKILPESVMVLHLEAGLDL